MIRFYLPFAALRRTKRLSERALVAASGLSRGAVRQLLRPEQGNATVGSIAQLANCFEADVEVLLAPKQQEIFSEYSTIAAALKIERDGFDTWKIHLFDLVDEFHRSLDPRLLMLPPHRTFDRALTALLASLVRDLCERNEISTPTWAARGYFLPTPWFVSEMQSLKASALLESPLSYRANNIFVLENFLMRA